MARFPVIVGVVLASLVSSCGSDTVCVGHIDPLSPPSMQIQSNDGSDSIAAIEVVQGPCRMRGSYGSFDAASGLPGATIERNNNETGLAAGTSDPCTIKIVSLGGHCATVIATVDWHEYSTQYHCSDNSNCCPKSQVVPFTLQRWEFTQKVMQISFGDAVCAGYDAGIVDAGVADGGAADGAID